MSGHVTRFRALYCFSETRRESVDSMIGVAGERRTFLSDDRHLEEQKRDMTRSLLEASSTTSNLMLSPNAATDVIS
jgi:hypothetical protein